MLNCYDKLLVEVSLVFLPLTVSILYTLLSSAIFYQDSRSVFLTSTLIMKWDVGIWTGLSWPRIETGGGRL